MVTVQEEDGTETTFTPPIRVEDTTGQADVMNREDVIKLAKNQNEYMARRFSTKYSAYKYKTEQTRFLNNFTYALIWIYFLLAAIYLGIIFVGPKRSEFSYKYKVIALLVIVLFPYLITPIEYFVLRGIAFVIETTVGNVFKRDDHTYIVDYTYLPNFFSY